MTPIELVDTLVKFIKEAVKEYDLSTKVDGESKAPEVHPGYLPPKNKGKDGTKEDISEFPYILVRYLSGEDSSEDTANIRLVMGTYSEDEQNGWRDPLNIATRIKTALRKTQIIGPYALTGKIKTELFEEQPFPFWFAVMDITFDMPQVQIEWSEHNFDY